MHEDQIYEANPASRLGAKGAMAAVASEQFDVMAAVGGLRGIIESVLPTLIFLVLYLLTHATMLAVLVALGISVVAIAVRAIQRVPVTPAVGGLFAMAISAALAWRSGQAADVFLWGILTNGAYLGVLLFSIAVRRPLLGVVIAAIRGEGAAWRKDPELKAHKRRYYYITWLWAVLFGSRLAIELPLYFAKATEALAVAKLVLGLPLFVLVAWFSWLLARQQEQE